MGVNGCRKSRGVCRHLLAEDVSELTCQTVQCSRVQQTTPQRCGDWTGLPCMMVRYLMVLKIHVGGARHICWLLIEVGEQVLPWWRALGVSQGGADGACKTQQRPQHLPACQAQECKQLDSLGAADEGAAVGEGLAGAAVDCTTTLPVLRARIIWLRLGLCLGRVVFDGALYCKNCVQSTAAGADISIRVP